MKIQCDNCNKKEARVFCSADEAALCDVCDQRVHHANKLASKHQRFSLLQSSSSHFPLCDICQEKRALLFCQQDRAVLCRDCDLTLHTANEHTQKHNRFLLTGIKLSRMISNTTNNTSKEDEVISNNNNNEGDLVPNFDFTDKSTLDFSEKSRNLATTTHITNNNNTISSTNNQLINGGSTSKISDYLIDMLPGWRFEDLLLDSSASLPPLGFYKSGNNNNHDYGMKQDVMSFYDVESNDKEELTRSSPSSTNQFENCWVPQAASPIIIAEGGISNVVFGHQNAAYHNYTSGLFHGTKQQQQETKYLNDDDDFFTVPQITSSVGSKRTRAYW